MIDDEPDEQSQSVVCAELDLSVSSGCANIERQSFDRRCRVGPWIRGKMWYWGATRPMAIQLLNGRHNGEWWMVLMWQVQPLINNAWKMPSAEAALRNSLAHSLLREIKYGKMYLKGLRNNINI